MTVDDPARPREAANRAAVAIDSGAARRLLGRLVELSHGR
jgi:hypothetical protein